MSDQTHISLNAVELCYLSLEKQCTERGITVSRLKGAADGYLGVRLQGALRQWDLHANCEEENLSLPDLYLAEPRGLHPHVSYHGWVCVNDGQGLSIDRDRPADIAAYTILAGFDLLEKWSIDSRAEHIEFFNELEGYWLGLPGSGVGRAGFDVNSQNRPVMVYVNEKAKSEKWFFIERGATAPREFNLDKAQPHRALYIHLDQIPLPPSYPNKLEHTYIESLCSLFSAEQTDLWNHLLAPSKSKPKNVVLLVSVPRQAGGCSLVGMAFRTHHGKIDLRAPVVPLTIKRHTPSYMRERGGASLDLLGKHVGVLGCGAIGAVVADTLAAAGVGRLTLIDNDDYSEENVFRHILEPLYIGIKKVIGLKFKLERQYPGLQVNAVPATAQTWLQAAQFDGFDGILLAFGAPSIERSFSRALRREKHQLPLVFTWLEALDLGGHSVLLWSNKEGCLDCLYRDDEGQPSLLPRTAFLEANQPVTRNLTGCGSTFMPYSALQSRRTGLMAAEQMLGAIAGKLSEPAYSFWTGEGTVAQEQGLQPTNWWHEAKRTTQQQGTARVFGRPCKRCREMR